MDIEIKKTCPLGSMCREVVDGVIHECMWLVKVTGVDPATKEHIENENCAIAWQPIMMIEGNNLNRMNGASIQSLRNETIKRQDIALGLVKDDKTISSS